MVDSILFFGRKNCKYSDNLKKFLKKKTKNLFYIESDKSKKKLNTKALLKKNYSYIICFRSFYILKKNLINKAKITAINFHPGTPKYRGSGCINYAMYNNERYYGSTCHLINEKIDSGQILDFKIFEIKKKDTLKDVLKNTHLSMLKQSKLILGKLFEDKENLKFFLMKNRKIKWSKKYNTLKKLDKFYEIKTNCNKKEIELKIKATNINNYKPYIYLHKKKFVLSDGL